MVNTPLPVARIISSDTSSAQVDPERFWGSYRPGVYFGLKTRSPHSPVVGMMWMTPLTSNPSPPLHHWCEQGDQLPFYSWMVHDGVNFGIHEVIDHFYTITSEFVKRPGGQHGGDWTARINVRPRPKSEEAVVSLFFYIALDGQGTVKTMVKQGRLEGVRGQSEELGDFQMLFPLPTSGKVRSMYHYLVTYANGLDELTDTVKRTFRVFYWDKKKQMPYYGLGGTVLPEGVDRSQANFVVYQVTTTLPYEMEVNFESGSSVAVHRLTGQTFVSQMDDHLHRYDRKFESLFGLKKRGFSSVHQSFAKTALSNMIGGIGYFYGTSLVQSQYTPDPVNYWPAPLYTAVPSRSFFPRGFLWDEGFHNLLIAKWDQRLSMDIIGHWLDLMNVEGWIPREQILGVEARAKVPKEFVVQRNENANPPTLFLPLQSIVKSLVTSDKETDRRFLQTLFPRLQAWYKWFNNTQVGTAPFTYKWRGRNPNAKNELNPKTLTSGLDDYPRASHPTDDERHLDLRCWMALASGVMADIAKSLNESWQVYDSAYVMLTDNKLLDTLHWSDTAERYCDYGLHTDHAKLVRPKPPKPTSPNQRPAPPKDKERVVMQSPIVGFVDKSFGYVSLFPFLLKILQPDSLKLGKILVDLQDPNLLWTRFGLRSLAKNAPLYNKHNSEHDPPYWRGAIWINMNYLAVSALHHYAHTEGPYQERATNIYTELRNNVINNMMAQYQKTGFIWEQYDCVTGRGKGTHPFTGWSALVVAMMAELY
ncbi:Mannosyl-oligosaccharide glucosidase [Lamellibrachia satsuma]|nr:Mannosyl-oligosaccharide glucosidase [Lamellibrachia satsuma]